MWEAVPIQRAVVLVAFAVVLRVVLLPPCHHRSYDASLCINSWHDASEE